MRPADPAPFLALALLMAGPAAAAETRAFVLTTDFATGGLSAVSLDTRAVAVDVASVHSDAVMRWYGGLLYVVNRFGQDNIQVIDPAQNYATVRQFSTGNGSNPQDIAFVSPTRAYVTRYELSDLLVVDPSTGGTIGVVPLAPFADADGIPEMHRMVRVDRWLFVSLQRLDRNAGFVPTAYSLIAVIDTQADTVLDVYPIQPGKQAITLTGKNPVTTFAFDRPSTRLLIGCAGAPGALDGGIEWIDPVSFASLGYAITESALGGDVGSLAWNGPAHSYAIVSDASANTALVSWSATSGTRLGTVFAPGGFSLTDCALNDRGELYVCDSDPLAPGLFVFAAGADNLLAGPLDTGLPPYQVTFDAPSEQVLDAPPQGARASLAAPWPNPARGAARLGFSLPRAGTVQVDVLDLGGRRVRRLAAGERAAGAYALSWDLADERGRAVAAGVYFVAARLGPASFVQRLVVLR